MMPLDICRCHGFYCEFREDCNRYVDTPPGFDFMWAENLCMGDEIPYMHMILIQQVADNV